MNTHYAASGYDGSSLVPHENNPLERRENGLKQLVYRYWCHKDYVDGLIPADNSAAPDDASLKLKVVDVSSNSTDIVDIELVYKEPESTGLQSGREAGETVKEARGDAREIDKNDPRLVSAGIYSQAAIDAMPEEQKTVFIGGLEYLYTTYEDSYVWTEANLTANIGKTGSPTGITGATADNWLLQNRAVREEGSVVSETETWRYSEWGWGAQSGTTTTT
jgi:hypothetical protein